MLDFKYESFKLSNSSFQSYDMQKSSFYIHDLIKIPYFNRNKSEIKGTMCSVIQSKILVVIKFQKQIINEQVLVRQIDIFLWNEYEIL